VILILQEKAGIPPGDRQRIVLLFDGTESLPDVFATARRLRAAGQAVSLTPKKKNLGKQLDALADEGFGGYVVYQRDVASPQVRPLVRRALKGARETQEDPA
jgi:hypothetical protein